MDTHGKVALVTGAGTGIGKAVAQLMLRSGYRVVLAGRRQAPLVNVVQGFDSNTALVVPTDVSQPASVDALYAQIQARFGRLDVLFNNAGVSAFKAPFEDVTFDQWQRVVDTNFTGAF